MTSSCKSHQQARAVVPPRKILATFLLRDFIFLEVFWITYPHDFVMTKLSEFLEEFFKITNIQKTSNKFIMKTDSTK